MFERHSWKQGENILSFNYSFQKENDSVFFSKVRNKLFKDNKIPTFGQKIVKSFSIIRKQIQNLPVLYHRNFPQQVRTL